MTVMGMRGELTEKSCEVQGFPLPANRETLPAQQITTSNTADRELQVSDDDEPEPAWRGLRPAVEMTAAPTPDRVTPVAVIEVPTPEGHDEQPNA